MSLWLLALCVPLALLIYSVVRHDWAGAVLCATVTIAYVYRWLWADRRRGQRRR